LYTCDLCSKCGCYSGKNGFPKESASTKDEIQEEAKQCYIEEDNLKMAHNSALFEAEGYGVKN
jgi:uncharacterized metal-binding protein